MGKFGFRAISYIRFDLFPIAFVIANFLARCANRKEPTESLDFGQSLLKIFNEFLFLLLGKLREM